MRVVVLGHLPDAGGGNGDAQLLFQFTAQRLLYGLTRFQLAPRKFPVPCVRLARWAGGQQHGAIFTQQNADGDLGVLAEFSHGRALRAG